MSMMCRYVTNESFDEERAFYGVKEVVIDHCLFDGPKDGESAFKECEKVTVRNSKFNLRYPFWHDEDIKIQNCGLTPQCRAALWYSKKVSINDSTLHGIKVLRECTNVTLNHCEIDSEECGWKSKDVLVENCNVASVYFMFEASNLVLRNVQFKGKYSFQYTDHVFFENCVLDTKDAFWHSSHVTLKNCVIKGEYLGWYSKHLTLIHCRIIGTQPFCYCEDLTLEHCEMEGTDLAFEKSSVQASVDSFVLSIKNPYAGTICVKDVGEIIIDDPLAQAEIVKTEV